jgi:hypothetical protein
MSHYEFEDTIPGFNETDAVPLSLLNFTRGVATTHDIAHLGRAVMLVASGLALWMRLSILLNGNMRPDALDRQVNESYT